MGRMASMRPLGLEPRTSGLEGRCSIQLSYRREVWLCPPILPFYRSCFPCTQRDVHGEVSFRLPKRSGFQHDA